MGLAAGARLRAHERATSCCGVGRRGQISGPGATRTRDLLLRRQALYPTELRTRIVRGSWPPEPLFATTVEWARRRVPAERVRERATSCSGGKRSIQLSYGPELCGEVGRLGRSLQPRVRVEPVPDPSRDCPGPSCGCPAPLCECQGPYRRCQIPFFRCQVPF